MDKCPYMTTAAGTPVADNQNSQTAGPRGPVLMQDYRLMEKMAVSYTHLTLPTTERV